MNGDLAIRAFLFKIVQYKLFSKKFHFFTGTYWNPLDCTGTYDTLLEHTELYGLIE